ncbi:MAG: iron chelate uptake ABC transporter family permease subunit [Pseudomonadota bacterium]
MLLDALTLGLGYNATLVTIGASLLGASAGITGSYLFLRKRALVSDAISHATLPGVALAFLVMVALGGDGRSLGGLLLGSAISAGLGLLVVEWLTRATRIGEDAAIGAVLSVFFGAGVVLLTIIQSLPTGRQAGLEGFLLGSAASMLRGEAVLIAMGGAVTMVCLFVLRRPLSLVAFDPAFAETRGINTRAIDLALMGLVLAVTVVGLKVVGLILIVAMLIIPAVAARFWSEHLGTMVAIAGLIGALSGYVGAAVSATAPDLPTGPIIVLFAFGAFAISMLFAPSRGLMGAFKTRSRYHGQVHLRQGLLALATGQPIYERLTLRLLQRAGFVHGDGVATEAGAAAAARALLDESRWSVLRQTPELAGARSAYDGFTPIDSILTPDQIAAIDSRLPGLKGVS